MQELKFEQVDVVSGGFQGLSGPEELFRHFHQMDGGNGGSSHSFGLGVIASFVKWTSSVIAGGYLFESVGGKEGIDNAVRNWLGSYELPSQEEMDRAVRDGFHQGGPL